MSLALDLDDTLLKTYPVKWEQHKAAAERFYGKTLSEDTIRRHWGKPTTELVREYYDADDTIENMVANYRSLDDSFLKSLHEDAVGVLDQLSRRKVFLGLVTNATRDTAIADLSRLGVPINLFNRIQAFDDTQAYKPDPAVFEALLLALARNGITDRILYIGDDLTDYSAAQVAGIDFIGVTTGLRTKDEFKRAGVTKTINRLSELLELLS